MSEKTVVVALGHKALGTTLPEQKTATREAAKAIADLVEEGANVVISHSNGPQVGMIHTAMNEFGKAHPDYTFAPMSVCSAMSQGYIGYDLQNAIRAELLSRGIYKPVATILTQVVIDPYDEAFGEPEKIIGRVLNSEEAEAEGKKVISLQKLQRVNTAESLQLLNRRKLSNSKLSALLQTQDRLLSLPVAAEFRSWSRALTFTVQVPSLKKTLPVNFLQKNLMQIRF